MINDVPIKCENNFSYLSFLKISLNTYIKVIIEKIIIKLVIWGLEKCFRDKFVSDGFQRESNEFSLITSIKLKDIYFINLHYKIIKY